MPSVEEKSLMLAELMGWEVHTDCSTSVVLETESLSIWQELEPYKSSPDGLAQFSAILLDHLQKNASENAITRIANKNFSIAMTLNVDDFCSVNQANILDEILRMNGKM